MLFGRFIALTYWKSIRYFQIRLPHSQPSCSTNNVEVKFCFLQYYQLMLTNELPIDHVDKYGNSARRM